MSNPASSEFLAAITGAIVGGGFTLLAQWFSFKRQSSTRRIEKAQEVRDEQDRELKRRSALAFSILAKTSRALTYIKQVREHLVAGVHEGIQRKLPYANTIVAFSSDPQPISFSTDELIVIRDLADAKALNAALDLPYILDGYIANMKLFREIRWQMADLASRGTVGPRGQSESEFTGASAFKAKIRIHEANTIIISLFARSLVDLPETESLFEKLHKYFRGNLGGEYMRISWELTAMTRANKLPDSSQRPSAHASGPGG